jgi:hypothetical protein
VVQKFFLFGKFGLLLLDGPFAAFGLRVSAATVSSRA